MHIVSLLCSVGSGQMSAHPSSSTLGSGALEALLDPLWVHHPPTFWDPFPPCCAVWVLASGRWGCAAKKFGLGSELGAELLRSGGADCSGVLLQLDWGPRFCR